MLLTWLWDAWLARSSTASRRMRCGGRWQLVRVCCGGHLPCTTRQLQSRISRDTGLAQLSDKHCRTRRGEAVILSTTCKKCDKIGFFFVWL